jgi:hypothetical protein
MCLLQQSGRHRNAELDVSRLPDDVTFNDPQPRMLEAVRNESGRAPRTILAMIVALLTEFLGLAYPALRASHAPRNDDCC